MPLSTTSAALGRVSVLPSLSPTRASICGQGWEGELPIFQGLLPLDWGEGCGERDIWGVGGGPTTTLSQIPFFHFTNQKRETFGFGEGKRGREIDHFLPYPQGRGARGPQTQLTQTLFFTHSLLSTHQVPPATISAKE